MPEASKRARSEEYASRLLARIVRSGVDLTSTWLTVRDIRVYRTTDPPREVERFYTDSLLGAKRWLAWTDLGEDCCLSLRYWDGQYFLLIQALRQEDSTLLGTDFPGFVLVLLGPP